jgi:hypothetical protein
MGGNEVVQIRQTLWRVNADLLKLKSIEDEKLVGYNTSTTHEQYDEAYKLSESYYKASSLVAEALYILS